ncbi:MAG: HAMP domain-containing histidine kinase [Fibrobacter sp.]|nr:HAMP domain-containing histidine kinase [Fibrobacter sp.]
MPLNRDAFEQPFHCEEHSITQKIFSSYPLKAALFGGILGFLLIHPLVMGLEELFFIHPDEAPRLHWRRTSAAVAAAFSYSHIPTAIAFTLLGTVVGYLYGLSIESYRHRIVESRRLSFIGREAANILHDITNPLAGISGFAELIATESSREELAEYAGRIKKSASRIASLLGEIRMIANEQAVPNINKRETDLSELVEHVVGSMHLKTDVKIEYATRLRAMIDPAFLERVIWNLLRNAEEALNGFDKPEIRIQISENDRMSFLAVSDNGPGIPKKIRHSLFMFGVTYGKESGTGIGLYVSYRIIRDHGGKISVTDANSHVARKGAKFVIELPKA